MKTTVLDSLDLPELEPYRTLRRTTHHWREGFFVCEGEKTVRRLLSSGTQVHSMLLSREWYELLKPELSEDRRFDATTVYVGSNDLLDTITGVPMHKRLMAIGQIPANPTLLDLQTSISGTQIHVGVEGIADAENMGTIVRTCAAFGAESLIVGDDSTTPFLRRSVRVSMGAIFSLRIHRCARLSETLSILRREHHWNIIGTTPRGGETDMRHIIAQEPSRPLCLVFGSEGNGLSHAALYACNGLFSIPMFGSVDSLNVGLALGITLYEAKRYSGASA